MATTIPNCSPLIVSPHLYLGDVTGRPLDFGMVFFGEPNKDGEFYPIKVFADKELTIELAQPIRTKGGFLNQNGDLVEVFAYEGVYSVKVLDQYRRKIFYKPEVAKQTIEDATSDVVDAAQVEINRRMFLLDAAIATAAAASVGSAGWTDLLVNNADDKPLRNVIVEQIESIADLSKIEKINKRTVLVKSYYAGQGKGGGMFIYDSNKSSINDGVVIVNGWVRQIDGFITPFMAGAYDDPTKDSSAALNKAIAYAASNKVKLTGLFKTFSCSNVLVPSNLDFRDAFLQCSIFNVDNTHVLMTKRSTSFDNPTKNVYMENIIIDGKRSLHTNIDLAGDGGRSGFAILDICQDITLVNCKANNCVTDGFGFFPNSVGVGTRNNMLNNVKLIDCEAHWNGRHGGSSDSENGLQIIRGKYQNNGKHLAEGQPEYSSGLSARLLFGANSALYGNGWDFETYTAETQIKNVTLDNVDMRFNAKESVNFYRVHDPETGIKNNITVLGGYYDCGLTDGAAIRFTTFNNNTPVDRTLFDGVIIDGVDLGGQNLGLIHTNAKVSNLRNYRRLEIGGYGKVQLDADYTKEVYDELAVVDVLSNEASVNKFGKPNSKTELHINVSGEANSESPIKVMVGDSHRGGVKFKVADYGGIDTYFMNRDTAVLAVGDNGSIYTQKDNTASIGNAVNRFNSIYSASGVITTSDARFKDNAKSLSEKEKLVANDLRGLIKTYKFKGGARTHTGVLAQEVVAAFEAHGLNAFDYGLLCFDEWEAQDAVIDSEGNTTVAAIPAGDRYAIRYEELTMFILAAI